MARFIGLVILIFVPLSIWGQNKDLLYRNGTTSGVVNENALKPAWSNVQNAPVFDFAANRIWFGNGTAQTTSSDLKWENNQLSIIGNLQGGFGASNTSGVTDWNDVSNVTSGSTPTLLLGNFTNGNNLGLYYHPFNFEYGSKNGSGNVTQLGIPYTSSDNNANVIFRSRYNGVWANWRRFLSTDNSKRIRLGELGETILYQTVASYTAPTQGIRKAFLNVSQYSSTKVFLTSSENGYHVNIELLITRFWNQSASEKAIIYKSGVNTHAHSWDIAFSSDNQGNIYFEKVLYATDRVLNIKRIEQLYGTATILTGNLENAGVGAADEVVLSSNYWKKTGTNIYLDDASLNYSNVGFGTTNPQNRLHVSATSNPVKFDGLQANNSGTSLLVQTGGVVQTRDVSTLPVPSLNSVLSSGNTSTNSLSVFDVTATNTVNVGNTSYYFQQTGGEARTQTWGGLPHVWRIGNDEQMRLNGTGLGVKTSTPQYPLDVFGDTRLTGVLRFGAGSNHSTITRTAGNSVYNTSLAGNHIFQSGGTELAVFDGAGLKLNQTNFLSFRNDASTAISQMTNGDMSYQPTNGAYYTRQNGKRKDYAFGVNGRQSIRLRGDLGASTITTTWSDTTKILYYWDTGSLIDVTVTLPSNPQNDVQLRVVSNTFIETFAFQVAGGTSQSIEGTPTSWTGTGANSIWDIQFISNSEGSQGGKWFITKIR